MSVPVVLLAKCRRCSKHRDPREFIHSPVTGYCWRCYENHLEALNWIATGALPKGCQVCYKTIAELDALSRSRGLADTRLVMEPKDGIYQVLCLDCDPLYQAQRADLYRNTPYGAARGI